MCTMAPGLEEIVKEELAEKLNSPDISETARGSNYG